MVFSALLMTLGTSIWLKGTQTMAQYEDRFMTIGTVRQIPDSFEQQLIWNAETKDYDVRKHGQYSDYYTPEDLLFPGAEYLAEPEQRAFYISYQPDYLMKNVSVNPDAILYGLFIAEFSPMEDAMPDESVPVQITSSRKTRCISDWKWCRFRWSRTYFCRTAANRRMYFGMGRKSLKLQTVFMRRRRSVAAYLER